MPISSWLALHVRIFRAIRFRFVLCGETAGRVPTAKRKLVMSNGGFGVGGNGNFEIEMRPLAPRPSSLVLAVINLKQENGPHSQGRNYFQFLDGSKLNVFYA